MLRAGEILSAIKLQQALGVPDREACFGCIVSPEHTSFDGPDAPAVPMEASPSKSDEPAIVYQVKIDPITGEPLYQAHGISAGSE
jgi:hypothetical protein